MSKVFVGLSGGVDSAVAAHLLLDEGHEVTAVFMKNWSGVTAGVTCPWEEDYRSAQSVAAILGIPLKLYDFEDIYRKTVATYLVETYKAGLTPNPDIMCNEEIKFKAFLRKCLEEGAEMIATGHYARIKEKMLCRGIDPTKDQSYFLYRNGQFAIDHTLFPLGKLHKSEVRKLAASLNLPNAKRPDSQGICFVGNVPMKDFLHEFIEYKQGNIVDEEGKVLGHHDGVFFYTIGQRHGLGIGGGKPYWVYDKDVSKNELFVTCDVESDLLNKKHFRIHNTLWYREPQPNGIYKVQVRYRSTAVEGRITLDGSSDATVDLLSQQKAIAPGQSAVIYENEKVIGGGIIT